MAGGVCAHILQIMPVAYRGMCNCRKNNNVGAGAPPTRSVPPMRSAVRSKPIRLAPPPVPLAVQKREVVHVQRITHRRKGVIEKRYTTLDPLEVLDTSIWGPSVWRILHAAAERLPAKVAHLVTAIRALDGALPCPDCRGHYHTWLQTHPLTPTSDLRIWLLDLHNDVNVRTGKAVWTADDLAAAYGASDVGVALETLKGRIGIDGWRALSALV
jgi:hypothetical protein